jgi:hypothetical protein
MYTKSRPVNLPAAVAPLLLGICLSCGNKTPLVDPFDSARVEIQLQFPDSVPSLKASPQRIDGLAGMQAIGDVVISVIDAETREVILKEQQLEISFNQDFGTNVAAGSLSIPVVRDAQAFQVIVFAADVGNLIFLIGSANLNLTPGEIRQSPLLVALGVPDVVSQQGAATASSEFDANSPATAGIDFDFTTSWFSNGSLDGSSSTYTWNAPGNIFMATCAIVNNAQHPNPALQSGLGFESILFQVFSDIDAGGTMVFEETVDYPQTIAVPFVKITPLTFGRSVRLTLQNPNNPQRGGFSELLIAQLGTVEE